jgi:hypothetical protein
MEVPVPGGSIEIQSKQILFSDLKNEARLMLGVKPEYGLFKFKARVDVQKFVELAIPDTAAAAVWGVRNNSGSLGNAARAIENRGKTICVAVGNC